MLFSIITATYNNEQTIKQCITSLTKQTFNNYEHIIIDGNSNDKTIEIVNSYPHRKKIISEPDDGIYYALNKGIQIAEGEIIGILHADDYYSHNKVLEKINLIFENNPNIEAVYSNLEYVAENNTKKIVRRWESGIFEKKKLRKGWMPPHPTFFVKKGIYERYGLFDTTYKIAADYELIVRFLSKGINVYYLDDFTVKMRTGGTSNKNLKNLFIKSKEDYRTIKRYKIGGIKTLILKNICKIEQFLK